MRACVHVCICVSVRVHVYAPVHLSAGMRCTPVWALQIHVTFVRILILFCVTLSPLIAGRQGDLPLWPSPCAHWWGRPHGAERHDPPVRCSPPVFCPTCSHLCSYPPGSCRWMARWCHCEPTSYEWMFAPNHPPCNVPCWMPVMRQWCAGDAPMMRQQCASDVTAMRQQCTSDAPVMHQQGTLQGWWWGAALHTPPWIGPHTSQYSARILTVELAHRAALAPEMLAAQEGCVSWSACCACCAGVRAWEAAMEQHVQGSMKCVYVCMCEHVCVCDVDWAVGLTGAESTQWAEPRRVWARLLA